ncbi:MAG: heavy-metal-associated domain-containing protein [Piscirickettsiaceae bacterium]|nr:heavy-metal-associated domain-containing protein [Piscirickettsiaceae bacterium]
MKLMIKVENIHCGGCANTITKKLMAIDSVKSIDIAIDEQVVTIDADNDAERATYITALLAMGYPEQGSVEGLAALKSKAKSVVSCAIGKIN